MAMQKLRQKMVAFLWFAAALFILFIFLQWGLHFTSTRMLTMREKGYIAKIGNTMVKDDYYRRIVNNIARDTMLTPEEVEAIAFDNLVTEVIVDNEVRKKGLMPSDETIIELIKKYPPQELRNDSSFLREDGTFDYDRYWELLSDPRARPYFENYERLLRYNITRQRLFAEVTGYVRPTMQELWERYRERKTRMKIRGVRFVPQFDIDDTTIYQYYEAHKEEFKILAKPRFECVMIPRNTEEGETKVGLVYSRLDKGEHWVSVVRDYGLTVDTIAGDTIAGIPLTYALKTYNEGHILAISSDDTVYYLRIIYNPYMKSEPEYEYLTVEQARNSITTTIYRQRLAAYLDSIKPYFAKYRNKSKLSPWFTVVDTIWGITDRSFYYQVLAIDSGTVGKVVLDSCGYLVKVIDKKEPTIDEFQSDTTFVHDYIIQYQQDFYNAWVENLKHHTKIEDYRFYVR
ncbi:SurA N-terminal domain-containing protein [candidate division WOR-3 bacterium]|nr:SurA N-terminal domain-containing protein [candidate division WOR-3 bacterium]